MSLDWKRRHTYTCAKCGASVMTFQGETGYRAMLRRENIQGSCHVGDWGEELVVHLCYGCFDAHILPALKTAGLPHEMHGTAW